MLDRYVEQVRLLLSTLPEIARETVFALKGGTAINLFYRDMPRLSVDIDLTYLPVGTASRRSGISTMRSGGLRRRSPAETRLSRRAASLVAGTATRGSS